MAKAGVAAAARALCLSTALHKRSVTTQERESIGQAAVELGLDLSARQIDQLILYVDLLERWNRTYNLTAVRVRADMLVQHVFDCLAVVRPIAERAFIADSAVHRRCLDVGSGGGLPGVVMAAICPEVDVVCVDAVGKKASFVRQVVLETRLINLTSEHSRVELLRAAPFDLVVSRAFASLADFTRLTKNQLAAGGVWVAMKGQRPDAEISALPRDVEVFHVEQIAVPRLHAARCLVWMKPGVV